MSFTKWILIISCTHFLTSFPALTCGIGSSKKYKLELVQMILRHGERAPIARYPTDPNPESVWKNGLGELTKVGMQQHYALGNTFRSLYKDFMTGDPKEVNVISSSYDRCIISAMSNIASFYPPKPEQRIVQDLNWQPIPVHYIPNMIDKYMDVESFCPKAASEQKRLLDSPEMKKFLAPHKEMFDFLSKKSGVDMANIFKFTDFYDCILNEKRYNLTIPEWVDPYWENMTQVNDGLSYYAFHSPLVHRLRAGPLLKQIMDLGMKKMSGDRPMQKFQMYFSHDANIEIVLDTYNAYPMKAVPYAAALLFELYSGHIKDYYYMRFLYMNSTKPENGDQTPHVLRFKGCEEYCPLIKFAKITEPFVPLYWETECLS